MTVVRDSSSILPFIPLIMRGDFYFWPPRAVTALKTLSRGPNCSKVDSGKALHDFIINLRQAVCLARESLKRFADEGYSLFFDDLIPRAESIKWFRETIPSMAGLMLRLPAILQSHYEEVDNNIDVNICEHSNSEENALFLMETGLRIVHRQQPGLVMLSQELAAALLACAFFCLFPSAQRRVNLLPVINFDGLFAGLCTAGESQKHKIKCIVHYFDRICSGMPHGVVSFERKILPFQDNNFPILYPRASFWSESKIFLCPLKVMERGTIEDCEEEALEVDFANKFLGGGALRNGCVQEEIRFMINPESIVGMLFLPAMEDNEAIEIVGVERFSEYEGYASRFRFAGDYVDKRRRDFYGRRQSKIVAIDALCHPGLSQFKVGKLLREVNKAFCGFLDHAELRRYFKSLKRVTINTEQPDWSDHYHKYEAENEMVGTSAMQQGSNIDSAGVGECSNREKDTCYSRFNQEIKDAKPSTDEIANGICQRTSLERGLNETEDLYLPLSQENTGIATGNWGCGAFGGDRELKSMLQWLAASQALQPFVLYFTFGEEFSGRLQEFSEWILHHNWTVGELWKMLIEYSIQRLKGKICSGFFQWVLP